MNKLTHSKLIIALPLTLLGLSAPLVYADLHHSIDPINSTDSIDPAHAVDSTNNAEYVIFHYQMKSLNPKLSDAKCNTLFHEPLYYNIENNQSVYFPNKYYRALQYKRLNSVFINEDNQLFRGVNTIEYIHHNQFKPAKEFINFVYNKPTDEIRGIFTIPHLCEGKLIGVHLSNDIWPTKTQLNTSQ
ncbi:MAG: hypothetical protein A3F17_04560 [Gammaproteobacteria bacterium RIFCSPHIGHO2_12_FULL_41_15]|nr:MAG: hypothetical protein A3F17_04560 [Gammaproteobacteria bacterium RIFCSPHIGHO2_12_FULL_41_15]